MQLFSLRDAMATDKIRWLTFRKAEQGNAMCLH